MTHDVNELLWWQGIFHWCTCSKNVKTIIPLIFIPWMHFDVVTDVEMYFKSLETARKRKTLLLGAHQWFLRPSNTYTTRNPDWWYTFEIWVNNGIVRLDSSNPGRCTIFGSSDTANVCAKRRTPTKEKFMIVATGTRARVDSSKTVEVELPLKATRSSVLEMNGHDLSCKSIRFVTVKRIRYIYARQLWDLGCISYLTVAWKLVFLGTYLGAHMHNTTKSTHMTKARPWAKNEIMSSFPSWATSISIL